MKKINKVVGLEIVKEIKKQKISQAELGRRMNVSRVMINQTIKKLECGGSITLDTLENISHALGKTPSFFLKAM